MKEEELQQLEKQVQSLIDWKNFRKKERLVLSLDVLSRKALDNWKAFGTNYYDNTSITGTDGLFKFTGNVFDKDFLALATFATVIGTEVLVNGNTTAITNTSIFPKRINPFLIVMFKPYPFTVDTGTSYIINTNGQHNLQNGQIIALTTDGTLPSPLSINIYYYIINQTGNTFQISGSKGGSPKIITTTGTGNQYYSIIQ